MKKFTVYFAKKKRDTYNYSCIVEAINEDMAKIAGRSELMAEGLLSTHYKAPVVTVIRPMQGAA